VEFCKQVIEEFPGSGQGTIKNLLEKKGYIVNKKRIARIMRENNLVCKRTNKFKVATTNSNHSLKKYPNIIKNKKINSINKLLVGDVSQFSNKGKDYYIATLMDVCNREVVGLSISKKNDTNLVLSALEDAIQNRGISSLKGCIHHTDSDVRYCSKAYIKRLKELKMKVSMCKGNAYENAHAESLFKTIKYQEINISEYSNENDMTLKIFTYIKKYNERRPHSALKGMSPLEYKNFLLKKEKK
jgi:putative transposase